MYAVRLFGDLETTVANRTRAYFQNLCSIHVLCLNFSHTIFVCDDASCVVLLSTEQNKNERGSSFCVCNNFHYWIVVITRWIPTPPAAMSHTSYHGLDWSRIFFRTGNNSLHWSIQVFFFMSRQFQFTVSAI